MYANIWKRVFAWFIDFILWFGLLGYFIAVLTHQTTPNGYSLKGLSAFFLFGISFLYYFLTEAIWGATLGKMLFKIKVVRIRDLFSVFDIQRNTLKVITIYSC